MISTVKRIGSLLVACLLMIILCGSPAAADGLLEAMLDIALSADKTIEGTLRIEAGGLLASITAEPESTAMFAAASELLKNGLLRVRYTRVGEGSAIGAALELRGKAMLSLDARTVDDEIFLVTSLLPGKTLVIPAQIVAQAIPAQLSDVLDETLAVALADAAARYGAVVSDWAAQNENIISTREEPIPAEQMRDAAMRSVTLRMTDAQWKGLLRTLAEAFAEDGALQQAVAAAMGSMEPDTLAALARQWADSLGMARGDAIELAVFVGEEEKLVGIEASMEPSPFTPTDVPAPLQGSFTYGHRTLDAERAGDSYTGAFTWGEDSALQAQFSCMDKMPNPILPGQGTEYRGRALLNTPSTGALELEVAGDIRATVEPIAETYDHTFDIVLSQAAQASNTGDLAALLQAPLFSAGFVLHSETKVAELEDFNSRGSFALKMGEPVATIHYTLESSAYTRAEHAENTVLRLDALSPEEMDALMLELSENAQSALLLALSMPGESAALEAYTVNQLPR